MKLKLTQPGYEGFTGLMGAVDFVDGVSSQQVSEQQAGGILNIVQGELIDTQTAAQVPELPIVPPEPQEPELVTEPAPETAVEPEPVVEPEPAVTEPSPAE